MAAPDMSDDADVQWIRDAARAEMNTHRANGRLHMAAKVRGQLSRALAGIRRDTPDMADVTRLVNADDPPAVDTERLRLIAAIETAMTDCDCALPRPVKYAELAAAALEAVEAAEGYALVRLPEPTEPEHQRPWRLMPEALWRVGRCEVTASFNGIDPKVGVGWDFGGGLGFKSDQVREVAAAMLAAADHAERLADEHNTAAQDAEEGRTDD